MQKSINRSPIFLIDIDGVACAHAKAICKWINKEYKINSKVEDIITWDYNFGPITFVKAVEICYPNENFIVNMEVTPGFFEFLESIKNQMIVNFVTTRKYSYNATRSWINNNFGKFDIHFVNNKTQIDFDYIVDDCLYEIISVANKGKSCFLINRPWNNNETTKNELRKYNQVYFVETFKDIINLINKDINSFYS